MTTWKPVAATEIEAGRQPCTANSTRPASRPTTTSNGATTKTTASRRPRSRGLQISGDGLDPGRNGPHGPAHLEHHLPLPAGRGQRAGDELRLRSGIHHAPRRGRAADQTRSPGSRRAPPRSLQAEINPGFAATAYSFQYREPPILFGRRTVIGPPFGDDGNFHVVTRRSTGSRPGDDLPLPRRSPSTSSTGSPARR